MMIDKIPPDYKVEHLFLLIGKNPLPNYVAALLLLKEGGRLYLVHSDETKPAAERLFNYWMETMTDPFLKYVEVPEAKATDIYGVIASETVAVGDGRVGLNYTGGTKAMAVYTYQAIQDTCKKPSALPIFSYLDARLSAMVIDVPGQPTFFSENILYELQPTLEEMVKLHAVELDTHITRSATHAELAAELFEAHQLPEVASEWRKWCNATFKKEDGKWLSNSVLKNSVVLNFPSHDALSSFSTHFKEQFSVTLQPGALTEISRRAGFRDVKSLCRWLDGAWLENYVLSLILDIMRNDQDCRLHDCGMGIEPKLEADREKFEVDIGVMQGYRLHAISCTTDSDGGMCKLKLFEAYERARNMGGDETFVALVCFYDKPRTLERRLGRSWDAAGKIRVFGRPDSAELRKNLANWFKGINNP